MRLATVATEAGTAAVVVRDDGVVALDGHRDVLDVLAAGPQGTSAARRAADKGTATPLSEAQLVRPVLSPGVVVCVGLNYRTHIREMGRDLPTAPALFSKPARALADPFADIHLPRASARVDYEGELAIVVGTGGRDIAPEDAWSRIGGLTVLNDVTMRDYQRRSPQWFAGKAWQSATPVGPWVVTPDEIADLGACELSVTVNGEVRQRAPLSDLLFGVPALVADISTIIELAPGDIIATGTPGGVGEARERFLADGDVVEVSIDGIGTIRNRFRGAA